MLIFAPALGGHKRSERAGGGIGNFIISTAELVGALLVSLLALAAPLAALAVVILFLRLMMRLVRHLVRGGAQPNLQK